MERTVFVLYERLKDDDGVIVQSFNLDYDVGRIDPFRKEFHLEYPALLARDYVDRFKLNGPTRNWIIDREGIVRFEWDGSTESEDVWFKTALRLIEKVKAGGFDR